MKQPPFISNLDDSTHCVPASVGMVLGYFLPDRRFTMNELENLTGYVAGKGAWEMEELLRYPELGLEVQVILNVSYREFSERGFDYLEEIEGPDVIEWARENTGDIELEKRRAAEVAKSGIHVFRVPTRDDITNLLREGWLVMVAVNARKLNGEPGFAGHRILIYGADKQGVTMHDPGPPPQKARHVSWDDLERAWADPNDDAKMLIAVRNIRNKR